MPHNQGQWPQIRPIINVCISNGIEIIKQPEKLTLHLHAQKQAYIYTSIIVCFTLQLSYNSVLFPPIYPNKL